jgi:hypothetical protein
VFDFRPVPIDRVACMHALVLIHTHYSCGIFVCCRTPLLQKEKISFLAVQALHHVKFRELYLGRLPPPHEEKTTRYAYDDAGMIDCPATRSPPARIHVVRWIVLEADRGKMKKRQKSSSVSHESSRPTGHVAPDRLLGGGSFGYALCFLPE